MPYSKRQLDRILNIGDTPLLSTKHRIPLAARVCETYIRRRIFAMEDRAAIEQFTMLKDFNRELRSKALDTAQHYRLTTLGTNAASIQWRRELDQYTIARLPYIREQFARHALRKAVIVWLYSYYGRAWCIDSTSSARINLPIPSNIRMTGDVLQPALEAVQPSEGIYDSLGVEFRQQFDDSLQEGARKIRGQHQLAIQQGESVLQAAQRASDVWGVNDDGSRGIAGRLGTIVRSRIQSAATSGTKAIAEANQEVAWGVMFITSRDGRVCRICSALDGKRWPLGDPDIVYPPDETHYGCRCGHLVITADMADWPEGDSPDFTWEEWLRNNNVNMFDELGEVA